MYSNSDKAILNKAVKALRTLEDRQDDRFAVLQEKVAEIARKGTKREYRWRHLLIRFFREPGRFYFKVSNPLTGVVKDLPTKDYMTKTGLVNWYSLALDISRV